jgi:hypothetical protein
VDLELDGLQVELTEIAVSDLESLATARAGTIREAFLAGGGFSEDRLRLAAPAQVDSEDGDWVVTELGVVTDWPPLKFLLLSVGYPDILDFNRFS